MKIIMRQKTIAWCGAFRNICILVKNAVSALGSFILPSNGLRCLTNNWNQDVLYIIEVGHLDINVIKME